MVILDEGLNRVRDLVSADITHGQLGTSGTAATESDTGLLAPVPETLLLLDSKSNADKTSKFTYQLLSTQGSSVTFREFELYGTASTTNYDRVVLTGISFTKDGSEDLIISKRYFYRSV